MRLPAEEPLHDGIRRLVIAITVIAAEKAGERHRENRDAILPLGFCADPVYIIADHACHARGSDDEAFRMIRFPRIRQAGAEPVSTTEDAVFLAERGRNKRHGRRNIQSAICQNAKALAEIEERRYMGAACGAVKDHDNTLAERDRLPDARHRAGG